MNEVILSQDLVFVDQNEIYTDSLIVAREFKRLHKNVLQDIKKLMTQLADIPNGLKFELVEYIDQKGEKRPKYNLSKDALTILVMGYSTKRAMEIKIKYIQEFNRMQRYIHLKEKREEIEEKERISIEKGSDHGKGLYGRKVEKHANREALSEVDKELSAFEIFELIPPKTIIH